MMCVTTAVFVLGSLLQYGVDERGAVARSVLREAREEAVRISPHLDTALPWERMARDLTNSATPPAPWLARGFILCFSFYLENWPADQQVTLLRRYAEDKNAIVRLLVAQMMAREPMIEAGCLPDLREAARDDDDRVRLLVSRFLLGRADDPAAFDSLLAYLLSEDPALRADAVGLLNDVARERWGWTTPKAALPKVLPLTAERKAMVLKGLKSPHRPIRWTTAEIAGMSGDVSLAQALMETAASESEGGRPARTCYVALGHLGVKEAVPFLLKAVERPHGGGKTGREAPAQALAWIGHHEAVSGLVGLLREARSFRAALFGLATAMNPEAAEAGKLLVPKADGSLEARYVTDAEREAVRTAWEAFVAKHLGRLKWDENRRLFVLDR